MEKNEFYESMRKKIEGNLPESILAEGELVIKEARKNNDVMMHGIMISREYLEKDLEDLRSYISMMRMIFIGMADRSRSLHLLQQMRFVKHGRISPV